MTAIQKSFSFFDSCLFQGRLMLSHQALGEWTKRQSSQSVYLQIDDSSEGWSENIQEGEGSKGA